MLACVWEMAAAEQYVTLKTPVFQAKNWNLCQFTKLSGSAHQWGRHQSCKSCKTGMPWDVCPSACSCRHTAVWRCETGCLWLAAHECDLKQCLLANCRLFLPTFLGRNKLQLFPWISVIQNFFWIFKDSCQRWEKFVCGGEDVFFSVLLDFGQNLQCFYGCLHAFRWQIKFRIVALLIFLWISADQAYQIRRINMKKTSLLYIRH